MNLVRHGAARKHQQYQENDVPVHLVEPTVAKKVIHYKEAVAQHGHQSNRENEPMKTRTKPMACLQKAWTDRRRKARIVAGMKRKLLLITACGALFALAASGQDASETSAKTNSANAYLAEAQKLFGANKLDEALKAFQQAAQLDSDNERAVLGQYISLAQLHRVNDGAKILDEWVAAKPDNPRRWLCKAMAEAETDRPEEALKSFEKLIELQPEEGANWVGKGEMLEALKRDEEALKAFDKAITLSPKHEAAWNNRGGVLLRFGKYDEAIKSLDKAIELRPQWAESWYDRACAYSLKGDKAKAIADLKKTLELKPSLKSRASRDDDFKSLRNDPDFKKLMESKPVPNTTKENRS